MLSEQQITALFKETARTASPLDKNTLAVPKSDNVRYLVVHRGRAEAIHGCSSVLGASGGIEAVFFRIRAARGRYLPERAIHHAHEGTGVCAATTFSSGHHLRHVMSNSFGFGGNCSSLVFSK